MERDPEAVLTFWLEECGPEEWYAGGDALDATIVEKFGATWEAARDGALDHWQGSARGTLAFLILTDQFSRNMFRDSAKAFATDARARGVTSSAIRRGQDLGVEGAARQFFYMPLEHSESLSDQERAVRLIGMRMDAPETLLHARAHRAVIRRFGRFPFRNAALGRRSTAGERKFLDDGGYGAVVRDLRGA
ncbi:MAG: DUF924 family protein [Jannaschia sp.]